MRFSRSIALRVCVDVLLSQIALFSAFLVRLLLLSASQPELVAKSKLFGRYWEQYATSGWLLTLLTVGLFYVMGVYHHVRVYRRRFKAVVLVQGVTLAHIIYGFGFYFVSFFPQPPRGVVVLSWVFGTVLVVGVRLARVIFQLFEAQEQRLVPPAQPSVQHVLVLGGAGYIGSILLRRLLDAGYAVRLVDVLMYGDRAIRDLYKHPRFEFIQGDFRHIETVVRSLAGMDAVIHLGAIVGDPACAIDEDFSTEINLIATRVLAEACKGYGIRRFVFASTCSVYGASDELLDERSALNPVSLYAQTKIDSERVLLEMADADFSPTILRFATIYGLSPRPRFDLVINVLTAKAVREKKITVFGGDQWRPFVHVADAARSLQLALEAPLAAVAGEIFNVGSDSQNYTINQIGELIHSLIPSSEVVYQGDDGDRRNYRVSFAKIRRQLNFTPEFTVEQGVREIETALREGRIDDYYDPEFNNYKYLTSEPNLVLRQLVNPWPTPTIKEHS